MPGGAGLTAGEEGLRDLVVSQLSRMMVAAVVVRQADLTLWKVEPPIFTLTQVSTTSSHPGNPAAPAKLLKVDMSPVPRAAPSPPGAVHLLLPATITSLSPRLPSSPPTLSPQCWTSSSFRRELLSTEARCSSVTLYYRVSHDTGCPEIWLSPRHHVYKGPGT